MIHCNTIIVYEYGSDICDSLSKTQHFLRLLSWLSRGKSQWPVKVLAKLTSDIRKSKTISMHTGENYGACLINHKSRKKTAMELGLGSLCSLAYSNVMNSQVRVG